MKAPFRRATWYSLRIEDANGSPVCLAFSEAEAQHLLKVLNPEPAIYLDTFDEHDICDPTMGLPLEPEVIALAGAQPIHFPYPSRYHS